MTRLPLKVLIAVAASACQPGPDAARTATGQPDLPGFPFSAVQADLFAAPGAQPNAWADYDNDGDLDLFVGFRGGPDRLYRNDDGVFVDVAPALGLADTSETRAAAWGDYDGDGHLDLYVGYPATAGKSNRLYRNGGDGSAFADVTDAAGLRDSGTTRQPVWVDYDQDGDADLFVAFRDRENQLYRNDGGRFTNVTDATGVGDPRRTVGVVWFDMDMDGDLDLFVANQNGDEDAFFRYDDGTFTDVAPTLDMHWPDRGSEYGSVGPAVTDYDNDGDLDLFVATYGPDVLWQNRGDGTFVNVAPGTPLAADRHSTTAAWGDADNDGWPDLFVASYLNTVAEDPDHLFRNVGGRFADVTPTVVLEAGASHGVSWADVDADGDLDLALANNNAQGRHPLYRNELGRDVDRSLHVMVRDAAGGAVTAGSEVRLYDAAGTLLGTRLVDTGGGYCSQGVTPVHFGLGAAEGPVRVVVTGFRAGARVTAEIDVDPSAWVGRWIEVRLPGPGETAG